MLRDQRVHYTVAPLVLRLALAAIFIYHGNQKVFGPGTELGAAWAETEWGRRGALPGGLLARVDRLPSEKVSEEVKTEVKAGLAKSYSEQVPPMPGTLTWHGAQYAVAWGELLGGIALLLGLLTRVAALGLIIIQVGAIWTVTGMKGFSLAQGGGYEYNLALIAMCLALVVVGGGTLAVDRFFRRSTSTAPAAQQASRVAVGA
jgi:uncharacterized membrane protein YphA (DoxX/SURF4 family)